MSSPHWHLFRCVGVSLVIRPSASSLRPPFGSIWLIEAAQRCTIAYVPRSGLWGNTVSVTASDNQAIVHLESDDPTMGETDWRLDWTLKLCEQKLGLGIPI